MTTPVDPTGTWPPTNHQHVQDRVGQLSTSPPKHVHPVTDLSTSGARSSTTFLRGDGTWAVPPSGTGGGTGTATAYTFPRSFRPEDFGATGNGTTDDTAAVQAAYDAAKRDLATNKPGGTVLLSKLYAVSAPIKFYAAVSTLGHGWSLDTTNYNVSGFKALPGFTGDAIMKLDAQGLIVNDVPGGRPDLSWHWGTIEKIIVRGHTSRSGPSGINTGWSGEATAIRNCSFNDLDRAIDSSNGAVSLVVDTCSMFNCNIGLYASGKVQVYSISGDRNNNLIYITGGLSTNVNVWGLKAEAIGTTGWHDPVVDIVNLDGGRVHLDGGVANTDVAKTVGVVRITRTGTQIRPRVIIEGLDCDAPYTYLLVDTISGQNVPALIDGTRAPAIHWNGPIVQGGGHGSILLTNGTNIKRANDNNMSAFTTMTQP